MRAAARHQAGAARCRDAVGEIRKGPPASTIAECIARSSLRSLLHKLATCLFFCFAKKTLYMGVSVAGLSFAMSTFEDVTDTEPAVDAASSTKVGEGVAATSGITRELIEETVPFLRDPRPEIR